MYPVPYQILSNFYMDLITLNQFVQKDKQLVERVNIRALIPANQAGRIIGKGGSISRELVHTYHALLNFSRKPSNGRRLLHTCAEPQNMVELWKDVLFLSFKGLLSMNSNDEEKDIGIDFVLPDGFITTLQYEKNQDQFKKIAIKSKTKILLQTDFLQNSTERIVHISVPRFEKYYLDCFGEAVYLLSIQLSENARAALSTPGNIFYSISDDVDEDDGIPYGYNYNPNDIVYNGIEY